MSLLLLALLPGVHAFECGTSGQLDALRGAGTPLDHARLEPPPFVHPPTGSTPPPPDRAIYGTPATWHVETEHFTVNWWDSSVSDAAVQAAAEALEVGWDAFVEEQGWEPPASSDAYYIWVYLDADLGSTTGYTTEYWDSTFPDGIPLIYINPNTLDDFGPDFYHALTVHELMHAIQFGMRPYDWDSDDSNQENWYWEASATHASELADPTVDGHQYTSAWYAERPEVRYDSYEGSHQYGMFVLNAWLEDTHGSGTMRDIWRASSAQPGVSWPKIMEDHIGTDAEVLWAGFSDAYGNETLPESALYTPGQRQGDLTDGATGTLDELGTHYWTIDADLVVTPDSDDVILGGADAAGAPVRTGGAKVVSVTALSDRTSYALTLSEPSDAPDDTGGDGSTSEDDDDTDGASAGSSGVTDGTDKSGCTTASAMGSGVVWLALVAAGSRRRRG